MTRLLLFKIHHFQGGLQHRIRAWLTRAGWGVCAAILMSATIGVDPNQTMSFQTFSLLCSVLFVAGLWRLWPKPKVEMVRELPRYATAGDVVAYTARLRHDGPRPLRGLSLMEYFGDPRPTRDQFLFQAEPGERQRNFFDRGVGYFRWTWLLNQNRRAIHQERGLPALPARAEAAVTMNLVPLRRGTLRLERAELISRDPFGLTRKITRVGRPGNLLVLPRQYSLAGLRPFGDLEAHNSGAVLAAPTGGTEEFASIRDYRQGDPLRQIDWKSSARAAQLRVKEFHDEVPVRRGLILDTLAPAPAPEVFEEAVSVAASFAGGGTEDILLDTLFVGPKAFSLGGAGVADHLLEILAVVEPNREQAFSDLDRAVEEYLPSLGGLICVFSAWDFSRESFVKKVKDYGVRVLVLMITEPGGAARFKFSNADPKLRFQILESDKMREGLAMLG